MTSHYVVKNLLDREFISYENADERFQLTDTMKTECQGKPLFYDSGYYIIPEEEFSTDIQDMNEKHTKYFKTRSNIDCNDQKVQNCEAEGLAQGPIHGQGQDKVRSWSGQTLTPTPTPKWDLSKLYTKNLFPPYPSPPPIKINC